VIGLDAQRRPGHHPPAGQDHRRLGHPEGQHQQRQRQQRTAVTGPQRPVDDVPGDQRHHHRGELGEQRGGDHHHHPPRVRPDKGAQPPQVRRAERFRWRTVAGRTVGFAGLGPAASMATSKSASALREQGRPNSFMGPSLGRLVPLSSTHDYRG
jgi:hypothetical protein